MLANSFFDIPEQQLTDFVQRVSSMYTQANYTQLLDDYGVRRTNKNFWQYSDWLHAYDEKNQPIQAGLLDFNRLENR